MLHFILHGLSILGQVTPGPMGPIVTFNKVNISVYDQLNIKKRSEQ